MHACAGSMRTIYLDGGMKEIAIMQPKVIALHHIRITGTTTKTNVERTTVDSSWHGQEEPTVMQIHNHGRLGQ